MRWWVQRWWLLALALDVASPSREFSLCVQLGEHLTVVPPEQSLDAAHGVDRTLLEVRAKNHLPLSHSLSFVDCEAVSAIIVPTCDSFQRRAEYVRALRSKVCSKLRAMRCLNALRRVLPLTLAPARRFPRLTLHFQSALQPRAPLRPLLPSSRASPLSLHDLMT